MKQAAFVILLLGAHSLGVNPDDFSHVAVVMRHGARTPVSRWFRDEWTFAQKEGALTSSGLAQARMQGSRFFEYFKKMGITDLASSDVRILCTRESRTIDTAHGFIDGWYHMETEGSMSGFGDASSPPSKRQNKQPTVFVSAPDDPVMRPYKVFKEVIYPEVERNRNLPFFADIEKSYVEEFELLSHWSSFSMSTGCHHVVSDQDSSGLANCPFRIKNAGSLASFVYAHVMHDMPFPSRFGSSSLSPTEMNKEFLKKIRRGLTAGSKWGKIVKHWGKAGEFNSAPLLGEIFGARNFYSSAKKLNEAAKSTATSGNILKNTRKNSVVVLHCDDENDCEKEGRNDDPVVLPLRLFFSHDSILTALQMGLGVLTEDFRDPFYSDHISFHFPKEGKKGWAEGCAFVAWNLAGALKIRAENRFSCAGGDGLTGEEGWVNVEAIKQWSEETVDELLHRRNENAGVCFSRRFALKSEDADANRHEFMNFLFNEKNDEYTPSLRM